MVYSNAFINQYKENILSKRTSKTIRVHKRYEPIWAMLHKLRIVMGLRDEEYILQEEVELDEGFFETVSVTSSIKT